MVRRFAPAVVTAILLPCLIALGLWQLDRSRQKLEIQTANLAAAALAPITAFDQVHAADSVRFRTVSVTGSFEADGQFLLDNKISRGEAGYHVITPLRPAGSSVRVLVNRGWVPWGADRSVLPQTPVPDTEVTVTGRAVVPSSEYFELKAQTPDSLTRVWQNLDIGHFAKLVDYEVQPFVVELDENSEAGGFRRQWAAPSDDWVERHKGYAFQWFGLAITLVVINIVLWRRRVRV